MFDLQTDAQALLSCILDTGELLLTSGAEVMRVEDTVTRLCRVYGFSRADVFTITSSIILTVHTPDGQIFTQTRRIYARDTNLGRVALVNSLSRELCCNPVPLPEFRHKIQSLREAGTYPAGVVCLMYVLISAAFSIFFGGSVYDALAGGICGLILYLVLTAMSHLQLNGTLWCITASALTGIAAACLFRLGLGSDPEKMIIGNIMLMIPGLAFTSSLRDIITGDTISGLLGLCEAVFRALAVAIGFAVVLKLT